MKNLSSCLLLVLTTAFASASLHADSDIEFPWTKVSSREEARTLSPRTRFVWCDTTDNEVLEVIFSLDRPVGLKIIWQEWQDKWVGKMERFADSLEVLDLTLGDPGKAAAPEPDETTVLSVAAQLTKLRFLLLDCATLTGADVVKLSALQQVEHLSLRSRSNWSAAAFDALGKAKALRHLDLDVYLDGAKLARALQNQQLESFRLKIPRLAESAQDELFAVLGRSPALRALAIRDLAEPTVSDQQLAKLYPLEKLESLDLEECLAITAKAFQQLVTKTKLLKLRCENCAADEDLAEIAQSEYLREITLRGLVTGKGLRHLAKIKTLVVLDFADFAGRRTGFIDAFKNHPKLEVIRGTWEAETLDEVETIGTIPNFKGDVELGSKATNAWVSALTKARKLERVRITSEDITAEGIKKLYELNSIRALVINNDRITDQALEGIKKLKHLQVLHLYTSQLTDTGMQYLSALSSLQELELGKCEAITDESLTGFAKMPALTRLKLPMQSAITDDAIARLRKQRPDCQITR